MCPPVLVSGNQWRLRQGHTGQPASAEGDGPTDFEGDPDPEGPSEKFVYTEKRASLLSNFRSHLDS